MRYIVQQLGPQWAVMADGKELARFDSQQDALADVRQRLEAQARSDAPASLSLRYGDKPRSE